MDWAIVIETLIKSVVVLSVVAGMAAFATFIERKVLAYMQRRLGPMNVGPHGILQLAADGIKLFTKEDIVPQNAVKPIFKIAPVIAPVCAFTAMAAIPFFPEFTLFGYTITPIISDINVGILFVMGVASAGMYAPLLAGMSSTNKWALLGAARTVIALLSFEVVSGLALLAPIMMIGSLSLIDINDMSNRSLLFNWKNNPSNKEQALDLLEVIQDNNAGFKKDVIIATPDIYLDMLVGENREGLYSVSSQDISTMDCGATTAQTSGRILKSFGVTYGQGWYFSKAVPYEDLDKDHL